MAITVTITHTLNSLDLLLAVARESNAARCSAVVNIMELVRKGIFDSDLVFLVEVRQNQISSR